MDDKEILKIIVDTFNEATEIEKKAINDENKNK